jgi:hypothetical protein
MVLLLLRVPVPSSRNVVTVLFTKNENVRDEPDIVPEIVPLVVAVLTTEQPAAESRV